MSEIFTKYGSQGFIQNFELGGGGGHGGSRMIVACVSERAYSEVWGHASPGKF